MCRDVPRPHSVTRASRGRTRRPARPRGGSAPHRTRSPIRPPHPVRRSARAPRRRALHRPVPRAPVAPRPAGPGPRPRREARPDDPAAPWGSSYPPVLLAAILTAAGPLLAASPAAADIGLPRIPTAPPRAGGCVNPSRQHRVDVPWPQQYITPCRAWDTPRGAGVTVADRAAGIDAAVARRARVIDVPIALARSSPALVAAVRDERRHGTVVIAPAYASGGTVTGSEDAPAPAAYPAALPGVLAVAALGPGGAPDRKLAPRTAPDPAAPGDAVMSVGPGGYGQLHQQRRRAGRRLAPPRSPSPHTRIRRPLSYPTTSPLRRITSRPTRRWSARARWTRQRPAPPRPPIPRPTRPPGSGSPPHATPPRLTPAAPRPSPSPPPPG